MDVGGDGWSGRRHFKFGHRVERPAGPPQHARTHKRKRVRPPRAAIRSGAIICRCSTAYVHKSIHPIGVSFRPDQPGDLHARLAVRPSPATKALDLLLCINSGRGAVAREGDGPQAQGRGGGGAQQQEGRASRRHRQPQEVEGAQRRRRGRWPGHLLVRGQHAAPGCRVWLSAARRSRRRSKGTALRLCARCRCDGAANSTPIGAGGRPHRGCPQLPTPASPTSPPLSTGCPATSACATTGRWCTPWRRRAAAGRPRQWPSTW